MKELSTSGESEQNKEEEGKNRETREREKRREMRKGKKRRETRERKKKLKVSPILHLYYEGKLGAATSGRRSNFQGGKDDPV